MPQSPQDVMQDPKFLSLSPDAQRIVLGKVDPKFASMSPDAQGVVLQRLGHATAQAKQEQAPPDSPWYERAWNALISPIGSNPMNVPAGMQPHVPNLGGGGQVAAYKQAQGNPTPGQVISSYVNAPPTLEEANNPFLTAAKKGGAGAAADVFNAGMAAYSPLSLAATPLAMAGEAPGVVGSIARNVSRTTGAGVGAVGTSQVVGAGLGNTPEAWQQRLMGGSMMAGGTAGTLSVPSPLPEVPQTSTVPQGGLVQRAVRSAMGMGEKPMVKGAKAALKENAFEAGKVNTANAEAAAKTKLQNQQQAAEDYQARRLVEEQNEVARQETAKANQQAAADHAKEVARVEGMNEAGQAQVAKRASLQQKTLDDSAALVQAAQQKALAVRAEGKAMYDDVNNAVGPDAGIAAPEVAKLVKHAEDNILAGSRPESIKQFRMMLEEAKQTGGPNAAILDQTAQGLGYENASDAIQRIGPDQFQRYLPPDLQGAQAEPAIISFKDLGGYVTELGDLMYNRNVPNDVFAALRHVRNGIQDMRMEIAENAGAGQMLEDANSFWRNYENVYNNSRNVTVASRGLGAERIGSPVARLIRTADAPIARNLLTGNISDRLIETLKREDPELGAMAEQIKRDHAESASLPKRYQIKPTPEAPAPAKPKLKETPQYAEPKATPEPKPLPESPNLPRITEEARQAELDRRVKALRSPNVQRWEMVGMLTGLLGQLFGRHGSEYLTVGSATGLAGSALLARALESPRVIDWLTTPTARDIAILNKLDPTQKAPLQQAITQTMINNRVAPTPAMRSFLSPSQSAAITAAIGAAYSTPQSIMLGMKMGQLSPTDGAAMLQKLRRSASAGPTRRLAQPETPPPPPIPQTY